MDIPNSVRNRYRIVMAVYFKAIQTGDVSRVAPVDKLSVVFTILLAFLILKEPVSPKVIIGGTLITAGAIVMMWK